MGVPPTQAGSDGGQASGHAGAHINAGGRAGAPLIAYLSIVALPSGSVLMSGAAVAFRENEAQVAPPEATNVHEMIFPTLPPLVEHRSRVRGGPEGLGGAPHRFEAFFFPHVNM